MKSAHTFLALGGLVLGQAIACMALAAEAKQPNIIFILTDDKY